MSAISPETEHLQIAHVTATFPPYWGGAGTVCYHNARQLARRGHDVHVFTSAMKGAPTQEEIAGFTVHRLPTLLHIGNMPLIPGLLTALRGFNIVHLHYPFILGAEAVSAAAAASRIPLVITFHNDLVGEGLKARLFTPYQRLSAQVTIRRAARLCVLSMDHFLSSELFRSIAGNCPQLAELPNGVDLDLFRPSDGPGKIREQYCFPPNAKVVLFVAALDKAHQFKNLGTLLRVIQSLPPQFRLLVVGDGDLRQSYERQMHQLDVADRVVFAGAIAHHHLPEYFRDAGVTVLPSSQTESFGLVLVESLACGTPAIASCLPGVRTVIEDGTDGLLVPPNDPLALAASIRSILEDEEHRRILGSRGRAKIAARYGWEQIGRHLAEIYEEVLQERNASDLHQSRFGNIAE